MPRARVQETREQDDDGELGQAEGDDAEGEVEHGPEDGGLLVVEGERVEVAAVAVPDGFDGQGDTGPLEELG